MDFSALRSLDENLFLFLNTLPHTLFLNQIARFFSFYPLIIWILIGVTTIVIEEKKDKLFIVRLVIALIAAGFLASGIIKPIIKRPRPDILYGEKVVMIQEPPSTFPLNNDFAFPSGHAAVAFAGAYIVSREESIRRHQEKLSQKRNTFARGMFIVFAALTAFSRIYLGKHYPLDVIVGGILGWAVGWTVWKLVDLVKPGEVS